MNEIIEISPSKEECNLAMLAHLLGIFSGFVGALVLWLVKREDNGFAAQEAREALNFQITVAIAMMAAVMLKIVLIGFLVFPVIFLANFVFCLLGAVSAAKGKAYRYPFALRLVS